MEKLLSKDEIRTPKGTKDYGPNEMKVRNEIFKIIRKNFEISGAVEIETPLIELRSILMNKYGEDEKLVFNLEEQGGDLCSLRYDLTVPFVRYISENNITSIKKFQIGRVYRRDQPSIKQGRLREFYQCDFDIAGEGNSIMSDAECLTIMIRTLKDLNIGEFKIKLNNRKLLDGIFEICGVPKEKFSSICSSIDKLDKIPWEIVKKEMIQEKKIDGNIVDKLKEFIDLSSNNKCSTFFENYEVLKKFENNEICKDVINEMNLLIKYLNFFGVEEYVTIDLSLARGLNYYTGIIYEAVCINSSLSVGSIGGGGRYDNLTSMFNGKSIPCVGFSIGIERIFAILMSKNKEKEMISVSTTVFVVSINVEIEEVIKIVSELWKNGISAEYMSISKAKQRQRQLSYASERKIPFAIIVGSTEINNNIIQIKNLLTKEQKEIPRTEMTNYFINYKK